MKRHQCWLKGIKLLAPGLSLGQADLGCGCHTCRGSSRLSGASAAHFLPQKSLPGFPSTFDGDTHLPYGETTPARSESTLETACGAGNIAPNPTAPDPHLGQARGWQSRATSLGWKRCSLLALCRCFAAAKRFIWLSLPAPPLITCLFAARQLCRCH